MNSLKTVARVKVKRNRTQQLYLSVLAGICISLGGIGLSFIRSDSPLSYSLSGILGGFVFSFGLFAIFALGLELFTGNCIFMSSYFKGDITLEELLKLLGYTLLGNVMGCLLMWVIFSFAKFSYTDILRAMANAKVDIPAVQLFARGVLCNIVISFATLLNMKGNDLLSSFLSAFLPVIIFVACGFEHSIADAFMLLFSSLDICAIITCFINVLLGNIVGGAIVAGLHYAFMSGNSYAR